MGMPAGTITCVFTDIEGSTRMLRDLGPAFGDVLERHDAIMRRAWAEHGGHEVKTIGDGFMVVFADAAGAVGAAVAAQRALARAEWPGDAPVRVRIGMHTGFARPAGRDYTALVINQAARVAGAARGGQVLLTDDTRAALEPVPAGIDVHALGRFRVRDFDGPVGLHAAAAPDLAAVDAPPRVRPADGHNLVRPRTPLVGRTEEVARLEAMVQAGRVTSVVGPGGVGKTRLASETALRLAPRWPEGAWFVDLAPLSDAALVGEAIADAVGAPAAPAAERWEQVLAHLEERRMLVVLDNCEHLARASARVASELASACPGVAVLATSREPLGLVGERVHRLAPLATQGAGAPAVELFLERSGRAAAAPVVSELCAELDGLPLAIELAAARASAVPPEEILRQVRRSPAILRSADPSLPERQRSLERLLDWSWDLLSPAARTLLGRLSVFAAGFDVEAAEAVGAGGDIAADAVPELLWTLIDASLVRPEDTEAATRYRLLATVRAHAAGRSDPADLAAATRRLAALLVERVGPERATGRPWLEAMGLELDTARGAAADVDDAALAQTLAWSIGRFHDVTDTFRDGIAEVTRFLDARPERTPERVALLTLLAFMHLRLAELDRAEAVLAEAAELAASVGAPAWDDGAVERTHGELTLRRGDAAAAAAEARRALEHVRAPAGRARLYDLLGLASAALGDVEAAAGALAEELRAAEAAGSDLTLATTHSNLAEFHLRLGDEATAARHQLVALRSAREQHQPVLLAFGLIIAARLVARRGRAWDAVVLQTRADALLGDAGYALYEEDRRLSTAVLEEAAERLGREEYTRAVGAGRATGADAAADLAEEVLAAVGSAADLQPKAVNEPQR